VDPEEQKKVNQGVIPRGKHNKIKKMKERYADQDDEERELKMKLLGAKEVKGNPLAQAKHKQAMEVEEPEEKKEEVKEEEKQAEEEEEEEVVDVPDTGEKEEEEPEEQNEEEKREIDAIMKEEDIQLLPEDVDINEIDKLTGVPRPGDILHSAVPMCAPYSVI